MAGQRRYLAEIRNGSGASLSFQLHVCIAQDAMLRAAESSTGARAVNAQLA